SGLVSGFIGNFYDNAKAPLVVLFGLETMRSAIGLRQSVANVRQSDAGRRASDHFAARTVAIVGDLDPDRLSLARGADPHVRAVFSRSDRIFDRIFDERLEQ